VQIYLGFSQTFEPMNFNCIKRKLCIKTI